MSLVSGLCPASTKMEIWRFGRINNFGSKEDPQPCELAFGFAHEKNTTQPGLKGQSREECAESIVRQCHRYVLGHGRLLSGRRPVCLPGI